MPASFQGNSTSNARQTGNRIGSREPSEADWSKLPVRRAHSEYVVIGREGERPPDEDECL
jgi:hypothetical protein